MLYDIWNYKKFLQIKNHLQQAASTPGTLSSVANFEIILNIVVSGIKEQVLSLNNMWFS